MRQAATLRALLHLSACALLAGCGPDQPAPASPGTGGVTAPAPGVLLDPATPSPFPRAVGQEIWLTFKSRENAEFGRRMPRLKDDALALARKLRQQVLEGADIGALAREYSDAPGAGADGFSGVLPHDPAHPDARDQALLGAAEGGVTEVVEWRGGWWFAKRIAPAQALPLEARYDALKAEVAKDVPYELRARILVVAYAGTYPKNAYATDTKEQALEKAKGYLSQLNLGADFAQLARLYSWDKASAERGGVVTAYDEAGKGSEWIGRFDIGFPNTLLKALWGAPVGKVSPEPLDTSRGWVLYEVLERRPKAR